MSYAETELDLAERAFCEANALVEDACTDFLAVSTPGST